jgi:Flp pilus assembly protein TadB
LDEIERALVSDDPGFADRIRHPSRTRSILVLTALLLALFGGLALITTGLVVSGPAQAAAAVSGFVLVVGSCWVAAVTLRRRRARRRNV